MINLVIEYIERNDNFVNMPSNQNSLLQNNTCSQHLSDVAG